MSARDDHPTSQALAAFLRAEDAPEERARVTAHLEAGCPPCVLRLRELSVAARRSGVQLTGEFRSAENPADAAALARRLAGRAESLRLLEAGERRVAPDLLASLLQVPAPERREAVRTETRFQLLGFARHLTAEAREEVFRDVSRAVELGELAAEAADCLDPEIYPNAVILDAVALAWGALGNAFRVSGDLRRADRSLNFAEQMQEGGSGSQDLRLELLSLRGSLRMSQGHHEEAIGILGQAVSIAKRLRSRNREVRLKLQLAKALGESGAPDRALSVLEQALQMFDHLGSSELRVWAEQARGIFLVEVGRAEEARELLEHERERWLSNFTAFADRQRVHWLEARIARGLEDRARAEEVLRGVQAAFREHHHAYDHALVTLDLAVLYLEEGRTAEAKRLAEELLPAFTAREVHRHALAALALFQQAVAAETATAAWVQNLARYLRRSRENPYLPYPPSREGGAGSEPEP